MHDYEIVEPVRITFGVPEDCLPEKREILMEASCLNRIMIHRGRQGRGELIAKKPTAEKEKMHSCNEK